MTTRKFTGTELVIATHNKGKLDEIRRMFEGRNINILSAAELGLPSPPETGTTFLENATLKALHAARAAGKPALTDDSGLCVTALDGAPGVYTADWAETADGRRDYPAAMKKINDMIGGNPDRSAAFVCVLVLAWPDGHTETTEGRTPGVIVWPPRGNNGFGHDPLFMADGQTLTNGEMTPEQKTCVNHRAAAFRLLREKYFSP